MKNQNLFRMLLLLTSLNLFSCSEEINESEIINPLSAHAGDDYQTTTGSTIILDGSASEDSEGGIFSFMWNIMSKPPGSQAMLSDANTSTPILVADKPGTFLIGLTISRNIWISTDEVKITVIDPEGPQLIRISEDINSDLVLENIFPDDWTQADYLVTKMVEINARLTIRPGVKVIFAKDAGWKVSSSGILISDGGDTQEERVYLAGEAEIPGHWKGLAITSMSESNLLKNTSVAHAGADTEPASESIGVYLAPSSRIGVSNSTFTDNSGTVIYASPGAEFTNFTGNHILGDSNSPYLISLPASEVGKITADCHFQNGRILVLTADLKSGGNVEWPSYSFDLNSGLEVTNNTHLKLSPLSHIRVNHDKRIALLQGSSLEAISLEANPIFFSGMEESAGYWKGIYIEKSGENPSKLKHVNIRHAGSTPHAGIQPATIHLGKEGKAYIDHVSIGLGSGDGVEVTSEGAELLSFDSNTIREHAGYPMAVSTRNVAVIDEWTYFINNGKNQVRIDGNFPVSYDHETVWKGFSQVSMSYHVKGMGNDLMVWSGLKVQPGVVLEMEPGSRIIVENANNRQGYIQATGTYNKNIIFKAENKLSGSWYGITISSTNEKNYLEYVQVLNGGKKVDNSFSANIIIDNIPEGSLTIRNSIIGHSGEHGIAISQDLRNNLKEQNISFENIQGEDIFLW